MRETGYIIISIPHQSRSTMTASGKFLFKPYIQHIILKTAVEYIPANKNQHKLDKEN
jgi:hypothetical protein